MSAKLQTHLERQGIDYELLEHPYSKSSMQTAQEAHVHGDQLAKSVILEDDDGYLMAVVPATHHIQLGVLHNMVHRRLGLATEQELGPLFDDCDLGAVPPVGEAYGLKMIIDDSLAGQSDIYFEAGDHTALVHMRGDDYRSLTAGAERGHFSQHG